MGFVTLYVICCCLFVYFSLVFLILFFTFSCRWLFVGGVVVVYIRQLQYMEKTHALNNS